ncbi:MAG TPA: hypothetical protein VGJ51_18050 [Candidatus Angelobacter sp.]
MAQVATQTESDAVRNHVSQKFIKPAKQQGNKTVTVNVGEVHRALGLHNRVPLVCVALKSKKFLENQGLRILSMTGPPSGQSTTVTYTYEILGTGSGLCASPHPLIGLRGIAKEIFKKLGGGEHFIRSERSKFDDRSENS